MRPHQIILLGHFEKERFPLTVAGQNNVQAVLVSHIQGAERGSIPVQNLDSTLLVKLHTDGMQMLLAALPLISFGENVE